MHLVSFHLPRHVFRPVVGPGKSGSYFVPSFFSAPVSDFVCSKQPTTYRREDDPEYRDDPEFSRFSESLSEKLFALTTKIGKLSQQINLLGTKRDTERARERVHDLLEEARDGFKEVGEGVKKLGAWDDLSVCLLRKSMMRSSFPRSPSLAPCDSDSSTDR